jgi:transcriptional regulator with XRE-family HTH domain
MNLFQRIEKDTNLTGKEIAQKLRISKSYYSMLRNGVRPISKSLAIAINQEFSIPFNDILIRPEVHEERTATSL